MNGILLIDKPKNYTSRDIVNIVGKELHTKKIGHTGTLDPLATGLLILCIGKSLKLVELLTNHDKEYIATIKLGISTDTYDITGNILKEEKVPNIKTKDLKKALNHFIGKQKQQVPIYSAIKVNGKKLYEYARNNINIELPTRNIEIYSIELLERINNEEFTIKCNVSKGTYIRSLVKDIGDYLKIPSTMKELRRTKVGEFNIEDSYTLDDIKNNKYYLLSINDSINLPKVIVDEELEKKIKNGQVLKKFFKEDLVLILNKNDEPLAIYKTYNENYSKPYRMF